eukprot:3094135-Ditylum_brightwellii.AAC.1
MGLPRMQEQLLPWQEEQASYNFQEVAKEAQKQILVDNTEHLRGMLHDAKREHDKFRLRVAALDDADETKTM